MKQTRALSSRNVQSNERDKVVNKQDDYKLQYRLLRKQVIKWQVTGGGHFRPANQTRPNFGAEI